MSSACNAIRQQYRFLQARDAMCIDDPHRQPGRATTRVAPTFPAEQAPHVGATLVVALSNSLCKNGTRTLFAPLVFFAVHCKIGRALTTVQYPENCLRSFLRWSSGFELIRRSYQR